MQQTTRRPDRTPWALSGVALLLAGIAWRQGGLPLV